MNEIDFISDMTPRNIVNIEKQNTRHIYLYLYKNRVWWCCGRSALLLYRLYPNIPYCKKDIFNLGVTLPVMMIDHYSLAHLIERIQPIEHTSTKIVIETPSEVYNAIYIDINGSANCSSPVDKVETVWGL